MNSNTNSNTNCT